MTRRPIVRLPGESRRIDLVASDADLDALAERVAMEVVGPVPKGYL